MPDPLESLGRRIAKLPSEPPKSMRERVRENPGSAMGAGAIAIALLSAIPGIIGAVKSPADPELKAKVDVLEADRIRRAVEAPGAAAVEQARDDARTKELDQIRARIRDLEARCPAEVVMPNRAPR